ncbi:MAG TPA: hypothetical protein VK843_15455 [Planctomycetota bacterium]|nr:hypothetical protein [Planctomycetota bacterium]
MKLVVPMLLASAVTGAAFSNSTAQAQTGPAIPTFAQPARLKAGETFLGGKRLFPSPVFHDIDGDGLQDIVVGDLKGRLTVALRKPGKGPAAYAAETNLMSVDGKEIDFHNW